MKKFSWSKLALFSAVLCISATSTTSQAINAQNTQEDAQQLALLYSKESLTSTFTSWGIDPTNPASINLLGAWKSFNKKKDVVVAIVDTGIDQEHFYLANNIFVNGVKATATNYGMDFSKNKKSMLAPVDTHGHGSHIAGIIKSVYPEIRILPLKYYNESASGNENLASSIEALKYAVEQKVDIINYSGGGDGASVQELSILKEAEKKGILVVVAAGNKRENIDNPKTAFYPASYGLSNVIVTTAHNEKLTLLDSSNFGTKQVDVAAPGYRIKSALNGGRFGYHSGTSQATAFVTGVAALIKAGHPEFSPQKIREIIKASAKKEATLAGKCLSEGRLDADAALDLANQVIPQKPAIQPAVRQIANQ